MGDPEHDGGEWRALGDVERHGLRAASELVDRLTPDATGDESPPPGEPPPPGPSGTGGPGVSGGDELVRLWGEGVRLFLDTFARFLPRDGTGGPADTTLDVVDGRTEGIVRVGAGAAVVWLHNRSDRDVTDVALHCGDLRSSAGEVLPASAVSFEPAVVDLPARSSRGVLVAVAAGAAPGTYRAVLLADGVPDAWLPIEVEVPEAGPHGDGD